MTETQSFKRIVSPGSRFFMAPEARSGIYSDKVDSWSIGMIIHIMLTGFLPFKCEDSLDKEGNHTAGDFHVDLSQFENLSMDVKDLIQRLLTENPEQRMSVSEALRHPWLVDFTHFEVNFNLQCVPRILLSGKRDNILKEESVLLLMKLLDTSQTAE